MFIEYLLFAIATFSIYLHFLVKFELEKWAKMVRKPKCLHNAPTPTPMYPIVPVLCWKYQIGQPADPKQTTLTDNGEEKGKIC